MNISNLIISGHSRYFVMPHRYIPSQCAMDRDLTWLLSLGGQILTLESCQYWSCQLISYMMEMRQHADPTVSYIRYHEDLPIHWKMWFLSNIRVDSRFAPSQWETSLQSNAVSHWVGVNLESSQQYCKFNVSLIQELITFFEPPPPGPIRLQLSQWNWEGNKYNFVVINVLTDALVLSTYCWGRDKMADISQMTISNGFSWIKLYEFRLIFHWSSLLRVKLTIFEH